MVPANAWGFPTGGSQPLQPAQYSVIRHSATAAARPAAAPDAPPGSGLRNPGMPLDLDTVRGARVNRSAADHRAATLITRRSVKKEWQAGWLLRAVTMIDLTTLAGDDTEGRVRRLCGKARRPVRSDLLGALAVPASEVKAAAVCVYHTLVPAACDALGGSGIPVAAVSTGFPAGLSPFATRLTEIRESVAAGAEEVDVVITRGSVLRGGWERLYDEVAGFRDACGDAHMKVILGVGELGTLANVKRAATVAMMAGADFVKTSTGKETVNATLPVGIILARAIRDYHRATGIRVGLKAAGGLKTARDALSWLILVKEELGDAWMDARLFRIGASSLLADIERQLEHHVTGRYSAFHRHPLG
ncbi:MAG: deoxyribose-phosphate aldolase [Gemmatimonadetes bacterium]|nr:deoxyribose-phosphate aldolase [Gemmatimonadota bacterium]MYB99760.1 deoxyribose-phosphate aldolase [Gemmatimonadota bacterium]MYI46740.1 deoxyribose-phosphate aldolase [Gemmatimonadota bacterium]